MMATATAVSDVSQRDMILITRDLNAKVRDDITRKEDAMGWHSCRTIENTGERFVEFCFDNCFRAMVKKNPAKS